jgi:predicted dehydrogenase
MSKPYRVAVLGMIHDHVWGNLSELQGCGRAELVAAWDANAPLRERVSAEHGCRTYDHWEEVFDNESLDAVYVFSSNAEGAELAIQALERGLHVLIEKPMAATLEGAQRMLAAAEKHNVRLMVNWPFAWWPQLQHGLMMAQQGEIGHVWQVRYRAAHQGPKELGCSDYFCEWLFDPVKNGGGAMMDYCCYGANLARVLLGVPDSVAATKARLCKTHLPVEDNAMIVMSYPRALAIAEGSWTQVGKLTSYLTVIYGTAGTLVVEPRMGGRLLLATEDKPNGEEVPIPPSPKHLTNSAEHFFWGLATGEAYQPLCQPEIGRDVQSILALAQSE